MIEVIPYRFAGDRSQKSYFVVHKDTGHVVAGYSLLDGAKLQEWYGNTCPGGTKAGMNT